MKKIITIACLTLSFMFAKETVTKYKVDGLRCSVSCCNKVKTALNDTKGVKNCDVDYDKKEATVTYDNTIIDGNKIGELLASKTSYKFSQLDKKQTEKKKSFLQRIFGS